MPDPVPLAPLAIEIQFTPLLAVHAQPDVVATVIGVPAPPAAPLEALVGDTANEHGAA